MEQAAQTMKFPADKLRSWETGKAQPPLRQAEKPDDLYHRPFRFFA
jgi:hypothetical protein